MRPRWRKRRVASLLAIALAPSVLGAPGLIAAQQTEPLSSATITDGQVVIDTVDHGHYSSDDPNTEASPVDIARFERSLERSGANDPAAGVGRQTASEVGQFVACFDGNVPADIKEVVRRALQRWDEALLLTGPSIEVDVTWTRLGSPSTLAATGPRSFVRHHALPRPDVRYPVALANELTGVDFSPRSRCARELPGEVIVYINSQFGGESSAWHLGPGAPPAGAIDLETVVMHEIGHGLGFLGSATRAADGAIAWPHDGGAPYVFESFLRQCDRGTACVSATSATVAAGDISVLTEAELWFGAANAPVLKLFAPSAWSTGSSLSHLDESWYPKGTPFSLMTPYVGRGEWHRGIDHATLTIAQAMGWPLAALPARPVPGVPVVGDASVILDVTTPDLGQSPAPADFVVDIWRNDAFEQSVRAPTLPARLQGLVNGDRYAFVIRGTTSAGAGPASERTETVVPLGLPPFTTADRFVQQMFSGFHSRQPRPAEVESWASRAVGAGRLVELIAELANEPEVEQRRRITRLYLGFFGRQPDVGGLRFWSNRAAAGESLERIALHFATATEFEQGEEIDDRTFITAAYERVLGRSPDRGGLAYWEAELNSGLDRGRLLVLFSESPEHVAETGANSAVTIVFDALLGRIPSPEESDRWEAVVDASGLIPLLEAVLASDEFDPA